MSDNSEDWGPYFDILDKIDDEREVSAEQAKAEEDYRHAEELATEALRRIDILRSPEITNEEVAALRFLTGIPRERK